MNVSALDHRAEIIRREREWHEYHAHQRDRLEFLYDPPAFDAIVTNALEFLRAEPGDWVLDLGCGDGKESLELTRRGMRVISADLSLAQLSRARQRITRQNPNKAPLYIQANAEQMPLAGNSLHFVYGKAILHHLDLAFAAQEIQRLLQAHGRASFAEPLGQHPLFWLARRLTPRLRTQDEKPVSLDDLENFSTQFRTRELKVYFLLAPLAYVFRMIPGGEKIFRMLHLLLSRLDQMLFNRLPFLKKFAWYAVVNLQN